MIKIVEDVKEPTYWYRKYSDGWLEQGGYIETTMNTDDRSFDPFYFPVPFKSGTYPLNIVTTIKKSDMGAGGAHVSIKTNSNTAGSATLDVTNLYFKYIFDGTGTSVVGFYWEASGVYK